MKNLKIYFTTGVLLLFVLVSCSKNQDGNDKSNQTMQDSTKKTEAKVFPLIKTNSPVGNKAADFIWLQDGKEIKFSDYTKGKFVLLNFWGTWCPPCRQEIPDIVEISKEMESKNLVVLGAALERSDNMNQAVTTVKTFWNSKQMYYPVIVASGELAQAYGNFESIPTTFLINDKGEIVNTIVGPRSKSEFMNEINKLMKN